MKLYLNYRNTIFKIIFVVFVILFVLLFFKIVKKDIFKSFLKSELNSRLYIKNNTLSYVFKDINSNEIKEIDTTKKDEEIKSKKYNPIVYIYNTHETETYKSTFESDYSVVPDVKLASYILKDYLNDYNIDSYVETKSTVEYIRKNNLSYPKTYEASRKYLKEALKKYDFKIVIDLHRDSVSKVLTKNKKKYAKIMFVLGMDHKNYKYNLSFCESLDKYLNKNCNGISRGIYKRNDVVFNQDLSKNAILIEMGGVDNTLEEINNSLYILAKSLKDYIIEKGYL